MEDKLRIKIKGRELLFTEAEAYELIGVVEAAQEWVRSKDYARIGTRDDLRAMVYNIDPSAAPLLVRPSSP